MDDSPVAASRDRFEALFDPYERSVLAYAANTTPAERATTITTLDRDGAPLAETAVPYRGP
ncbi:MAG: hypothetical protein AB7I08_15150 [Thermoleophilia bacterium]